MIKKNHPYRGLCLPLAALCGLLGAAAASAQAVAASTQPVGSPAQTASASTQTAAVPFTPKTYIKAVIDASPAMRRAEQTFHQAENNYRSSLLDAALPAFNLSAAMPFYDDQEPRLRAERGDVSSSLSANWNLYDSANSPLKRVTTARLDYAHARLTLDIARQNEAIKALGRFYSLYSAQKRILTSKANLTTRERQYKDTNEQFQSGTRSKIEVTQSEGDKLQSELSLAQAEAAAVKALMAFNELINAEPEAAQAVEVSTTSAEIALPLPREDVARALRDNFALRRQRLALEKTRITNRSAVLASLPRLRVDAAWTKTALGILGTPGGSWDGNPSYRLGASLSFPFGFLGAQNYLDVRTQEYALKAAELDLEDSERTLKTGVLSAQTDIALQVKSRQLLEFQVKALNATTDNLLSEYSLGGASSLQLDSSQTKYLDASNSQITALNDLDLALANYKVLMGEKIWE
ncbi:MAG: TolC family protein [Elusimicrobiales bacterium]